MTIMPEPINEYFIKPVINKTGYNPVNTITYGLLLIIGTYTLYRLLKKLGYKIDMRLLKASIPFILLVSVWHSLTDAGVYPYGFFTTTPGLYIPVIMLFAPLITLAKMSEKINWKYEYIYSGVSGALLISQLVIMARIIPATGFNVEALSLVVFYTMITTLIVIIISNYWQPLKNKLNQLMMITQMLDASATYVSIEYYNYAEQHVIPRLLFNWLGTSSFFLWKALILGAVIYLLSKDKKNKELNNLIRIIFITYGLAIGVRDLLRLCLGV